MPVSIYYRVLYIYIASTCANVWLLVSLRKFAWLTVVFLHVISDWKFRWWRCSGGDVPQCKCSPLRLWACYSEHCSVVLVSEGGLDRLIRFCGGHTERALASVGVLFTLGNHLVLTKNVLTVHVKHKQHHLSWQHSCSPSPHFCRPLSHPLRSPGQCVRLITSRRVETGKVTA